MAVKQFLKSSRMAALAVGVAFIALPVAANAEPGEGRGQWRGGDTMQQSAPEVRESRGGEDRGGENRGGGGGGWQNRGTAVPQQQAGVPQQQAGNWHGNDGDRHQDRARGNDGWRGNDNRSWDNRGWDNRGGDNRGWNNNARFGYYRGYNQNWNRDWRHDNRYNWSGYRNDHRSIFQLGNYYSPYRGYSYRRLTIGFTLNSLFFGSNYVIDNPWMYRLPEAYGPYRWVRYYDDAVLVNIYNGEVEDVIYNFFW